MKLFELTPLQELDLWIAQNLSDDEMAELADIYSEYDTETEQYYPEFEAAI